MENTLTAYEQWQQYKYGNVLLSDDPLFSEDEIQDMDFEKKLAVIEWLEQNQ